ncbi:MAG: Na+/H+ antiporter [Waterburya sp.]
MISPFLGTEITILILLLIACIGSIYFKRFQLPYTVGLVIVGLLLGFAENNDLHIQHLALSPEIILFLFIPPLVFASASNINHRLFLHNLKPALTLAGPGLVVSVAIIGGLLNLLTPLNLGQAFVFGALISASDPVAVVALFEELGVPKRLNMLVDGESMLNDATAIVAFEVVLSVIESGVFQASTLLSALIKVVIVLLGGIMVGLLTGTLMGVAIRVAKDNPLIQASVSLLVAYLAFIIAEHYLHVSGVIAVMTAGLMVGRYKSYHLSPDIRNYLNNFWGYISFLANSLIFLLVGLTASGFILKLPLTQPNFWLIIICTIVVTYLARGLMIFSIIPLINPFLKAGPINWQYQLVSFWGGLKGAVALALALSLANDFPNRDLIIALTLGVALFTILVGGTTMENLLSFLKLDQPPLLNQMAEKETLLSLKKTVKETFVNLGKQPLLSLAPDIVEKLSHNYQSEIEHTSASLESFRDSLKEKSSQLNSQVLWLEAIAVEKRTYERAYDLGFLMPRTLDRLKFMINLREANIEEGKIPPRHYSFQSLKPQGEDSLASIIGRFSPQSKWLRQEQEAQMQSEYEFNLILAQVSEQIIEKIEKGIKAEIFRAELGQDCLNYYQFVREKALEKQQALASQQPALDRALQEKIAKQSALVKAQEELEEAIKEGFVSEEMAQKIKAELTATVAKA